MLQTVAMATNNLKDYHFLFDQCELLAVVDVARDLRVDFLKLASSRDFETSSRTVKKL